MPIGAYQLKRVSAEPDGETPGLANYTDEALEEREICCVFDEATQIPIAGTSTAPAFHGKLQMDSRTSRHAGKR